jgi:membrane-associated protein
MELILLIADFILHIDSHLTELIQNYGTYIYAILFLIVFCETGLVVTPFLPGDSLLFAAGALAVEGKLSLSLLFILLTVAAILGDAVNYWTGRTFGLKGFSEDGRFLNTKYIEKTNAFYAKHGPSTLVIARFLPIVRTFAPFVAGMGHMNYRRFTTYNVTGAVLWVGLCLLAGRLFGNIPVVKENFSLVVLGIIVVSLIPGAVAVLRSWFARPAPPAP